MSGKSIWSTISSLSSLSQGSSLGEQCVATPEPEAHLAYTLFRRRTSHQWCAVRGMAAHGDLVHLVHGRCADLFVFNWQLGEAVDTHGVPDLGNPHGMALLPGTNQEKTYTVIISDWSGGTYYLHWVEMTARDISCNVVSTKRQELKYPPWGLCVDSLRQLVIVSGGDHALHVYSNRGMSLQSITTPNNVVPRGVASSRRGYVISTSGGELLWLSNKGQMISKLTPSETHWMTRPVSLALDKEGRLLVTDHDSHAVVLLSSTGEWKGHLVPEQHFTAPRFVCLDQKHRVICVAHGPPHSFTITTLDYQQAIDTAIASSLDDPNCAPVNSQ